MAIKHTLLFLLLPFVSMAQQLPNSDFENWTNTPASGNYRAYDQPDNWATGNAVCNVAPFTDAPTQKTTDAYSGTYGAKLITRSIFGQIAAGNLFTGTFALNMTHPEQSAQIGIPFTNKPTAFNVYYKYTSVTGDSCAIYVYLYHKNTTTGKRDTIGKANFQSTTSTTAYELLSLPITYTTSDTPDSIAVVFTSSAGGAALKGRAGSTLFVDAFSLDYTTTGTHAELSSTGAAFFPNPSNSQVTLSNAPSDAGTLYLYNNLGERVREVQWNGSFAPVFSLSGIPNGVYTAVIVTREEKYFSGKLIVKP